ncbi:MAG: hypothetical protein IPK78_18265 [Rhodospirillales bacterium]|nr:hypothetical protein [Rhodospirillales bacterium]
MAAGELMPNPRNWRTHPAMQATALGKGLETVGWVSDVIVNRTTGHLVDGHLRVALALKRGAGTLVPVKFVELTAEEERAVLVTLDPLAAMATTDEAMLLENVRSLDGTDFADMVADVAKHLGINGVGCRCRRIRRAGGQGRGVAGQVGRGDGAVVAAWRALADLWGLHGRGGGGEGDGWEQAQLLFTSPPY